MTVRKLRHSALLACALVIAAPISGNAGRERDVRTVKAIEFRGLVHLSRYEILRHTAYRVDGETVVIDVGSLRDALDRTAMVRRYFLEKKEGRLSVTVEENAPAHLILLEGGAALVPVELDAAMRVISTGLIHAAERPVILAAAGEMAGGVVSARLRAMLNSMKELESTGLPVMRELEEVDMTALPRLRVRLRGRPTVFTLDTDRSSFESLSVLLGYLDAVRYYPAAAEVRSKTAVLK